MQTFVAEVMANVRANVASLGGNGLVSYRMNQCVLMCNPHKNQVCCPQYHLVHCGNLTGVHNMLYIHIILADLNLSIG